MIPHNRAQMSDKDGRPTRDWYDWFRRLGEVFEPYNGNTSLLDNKQDKLNNGSADGQPLVWNNTAGKWLGGDYAVFPPTTTPSSPVAGMVYYDSGTNKLRCYNGSIWNDLF